MDTAVSHKAVAFVPLKSITHAAGPGKRTAKVQAPNPPIKVPCACFFSCVGCELTTDLSTGYPCHFYWLPLPSVRTVAACCVACGSHDICTRIGSRVTMPVPSGRNFMVVPSLHCPKCTTGPHKHPRGSPICYWTRNDAELH